MILPRCEVLRWRGILSCAILLLNGGFARAGEAPVSWVNPLSAAGPGLSHQILKSEAMAREVGYVVWTPPGYEANGTTRYPVVYFLHGMGGNESADAGGFSGLLARGIERGWLPPVMGVFPNGGRSGYRGEVERMILDELVPLIDQRYRTLAGGPSTRLVAGFSMGGAGAVRLAIEHPGVFGAAGSWGGGMGRGADDLLQATDRAAVALKRSGFEALLINGDRDRPDAYAPLATKFAELGVPHEVVVLADTPHNLGLYYERAGERMARFLGKCLPTGAGK